MKALRPVARLFRAILNAVMMVSLAVLGLSILTQIVLREIFSHAFLPLDDIIPYSFSLSTFAGAALLFGECGHIAITIFSDIMPAALRRGTQVFAHAVVVAFLLFLLYFGYDFTLDGSYQYSPLLNIRLCYVYAIVPFSALAALVFLAAGEGRGNGSNEQ